MGACVRFPAPAKPIEITIPGGAKLTSNPTDTHDQCSPITSIFQMTAPAMGAVQPAFDVVGLFMVQIEFAMCLLALIGAVLALLGNPALATMFPLPTIKNTADNEPIPGFAAGEDTKIPDVTCAVQNAINLICKALKLVGLIPQLSMIVTIKDSLNALMALMSCVQAKINSLSDAAKLIPQDTGDPIIDQELACAREAMSDYFAHAAGPLVGVLPLMKTISKAAEPVKKGLPSSVSNILELAVNLGIIPFSDDAAKQQFLDLITQLKSGLAIQIPDFTDISSIPTAMDQIRQKLGPIVGAVETVQKLTEKLQNC